MADDVSKSWFCVFNNPIEHGYVGEPNEIVDRVIDEWIHDCPTRTCAVNYCISADGLHHLHCVLEDVKAMRFSVVKKAFPCMHIEPTKGSKEQAEDYINKRGKFEEKGEIVVYSNRHGEIKGFQGQRNDLSIIEELINQGKTPNDIMSMSLQYRRYDKIIRDGYYAKRRTETAFKRDVITYWHVGASGTGKSYEAYSIVQERGEDSIYFLTDYDGGFDKYNGEPVLFLDEFRGQIKFSQLLSMLDGYKGEIHCRYTNAVMLWDTVHITSVLPPEVVYNAMVQDNRHLDAYEQLKRRIDYVVYHWTNKKGEYKKFVLPMSDYVDFECLKLSALATDTENSFIEVEYEQLPFAVV